MFCVAGLVIIVTSKGRSGGAMVCEPCTMNGAAGKILSVTTICGSSLDVFPFRVMEIFFIVRHILGSVMFLWYVMMKHASLRALVWGWLQRKWHHPFFTSHSSAFMAFYEDYNCKKFVFLNPCLFATQYTIVDLSEFRLAPVLFIECTTQKILRHPIC